MAARLPQNAPPLPAPDNSYAIVNVSTAQQLADACWNLTSNQAIVIAAGTYNLASVNFPNGVDGRLTVGHYGAAPISHIQIRGATLAISSPVSAKSLRGNPEHWFFR